MGSNASHLRGSSVHSIIYLYIWVVGEKLRTHTTPLRLLRRQVRSFYATAIFFASASNPPLLLQFFMPQLD